MSAARATRTRRRATAEAQWEYKTDPIQWRVVTTMNVRDLSNDDDFLSHILIEKLGAGVVPLLVHRMDQARSLPKTKTEDLLAIVHKLVISKAQRDTAIRQAVDELLKLVGVQYYIHKYEQKQINAFATHACRYFEFYMPSGAIEIAHTDRYTHKTGKSELCILATRPLAVGSIIQELKGSMADLSKEEEYGLKHGEPNSSGLGIRKDFSVIHSRQRKMNHLFLGPARFVNHDCENNVELFRDGRCITFRVIRPIGLGDEVTTHYGSRYFGYKNKDCLCASCERKGKGGYSTQVEDGTLLTAALDEGDSDSTLNPFSSDEDNDAPVNVDERRTRRGVYHVVKDKRRRMEAMQLDDEGTRTGVETPVAAIEPVAEAASMLPPLPDTRASSSAASETPGVASRSSSPSTESTPEVTPPTSMSPPRTETVIKWKNQFLDRYLSAAPGTINLSTTISRHVATTGLAEDLKSLEHSSVLRESTNLGRPDLKRKAQSIEDRSVRLTPVRDPSLPEPPKVNPMRRAIEKLMKLNDSIKPIPRSPRSPIPRATEEDEEHEEPEEQTTRTLRPRKPLPERFYDVTVRRIAKLPPHRPIEPLPAEPEAEAVAGFEANANTPLEPVPAKEATDQFPKCKTCLKTIPVIYLDHKVVEWGPSDADTSGEHECPRCMRHFNIYKLRWPRRVNKPGFSSIATPAGTATPLDPKPSVKLLLNAVDSRLAATSSKPGPSKLGSRYSKAGRKRRRMEALQEEVEEDAPAAPARRPKGRPRKVDRKGKGRAAQPLVARGSKKNGMPHRAVTPTIRLQPSAKSVRGRPRKRAMTPVSVGGSSKARANISALQAKISANAKKNQDPLRVKLRGRPRGQAPQPRTGSRLSKRAKSREEPQEDEDDSNASGSESGSDSDSGSGSENDEDGDTSESDEEIANDLLTEQDDGWVTDNEGLAGSSPHVSAATTKISMLKKRSIASMLASSATSSRAPEERTIPAVLLNLNLPASNKSTTSPTVRVSPRKTPTPVKPSTSAVSPTRPGPTPTPPTLTIPARRSPRKDLPLLSTRAIPPVTQAPASNVRSKPTQSSPSTPQPSASSSKSVASPDSSSSTEGQRLRLDRKVQSSPLTFYGTTAPAVAPTTQPRSPPRPAVTRVGGPGTSAYIPKVASSSQRSPRRGQDIIDLPDSDDVILVSHVHAKGSDVIDIEDDDDEPRLAKKLRKDDGSFKVTASSSRSSQPNMSSEMQYYQGNKRPRVR